MPRKNVYMFLFSILLSVIPLNAQSEELCPQSFREFAYNGPSSRRTNGVILPNPTWNPESLTILSNLRRSYSLYRTELSRSIEGHVEIWVSLSDGKHYFYLPDSSDGRKGFGIYTPHSQNFEIVPHYIENTQLYAVKLHTSSDGTVWGEVAWDNLHGAFDVESAPVLSRFNEDTRHFEFAEGVLETPVVQGYSSLNHTHIVLDDQDIFWIFAPSGEIYRYDPASQITELQANGRGEVRYVTQAHNGDIYLSLAGWSPDLLLPQDGLFRFSTSSGEMESVEVPEADWPDYVGLLVDRTGRLWLGAIGYRDLDNTWKLINPSYLKTFSAHLGQYMWSAPKVLFESSDGKLWFNKYLDSSLWAEGTAWFDPETNEGCLITNVPTSIIEDDERHLWIVVDGVLYSKALNE